MALRQTLPRAQWKPAHFYNLNKQNKAKRLSTVKRYPDGAILHWDANADTYDSNYLTELTGGPHKFNYNILSPQYQRAFDGSYTDVGAKPAVDVFGGQKWLRSCGAVTNLANTDTTFNAGGTTPPIVINNTTHLGVACHAITFTPSNTSIGYAGCIAAGKRAQITELLTYTGSYAVSISRPLVGGENIYCYWTGSTAFPPTYIYVGNSSAFFDKYGLIASTHTIQSGLSGVVSPTLFLAKSVTSDLTVYVHSAQLTQTSYPVPYVPPGVTQPASNATTTNGSWFTLPDGSPLWQALDGKPDGVELVTNGGFDSDTVWTKQAGWTISGGLANVDSSAAGSTYIRQGAAEIGARYRITFTVSNFVSGQVSGSAGGASVSSPATANGTFVHIVTAPTTAGIGIYASGSTTVASVDNISIQRIQPQPLTLATRVRMGVGSGDLANSSVLNVLTPDDVAGRFLAIQKDGSGNLSVKLSDGTNTATVPMSAWNRNDILDFFPQVLTGGTQMRVGYKTKAATSITWGDAATYAGTFGPDVTLKRLMVGYANAYPMWLSRITSFPKQATDAEAMEALV